MRTKEYENAKAYSASYLNQIFREEVGKPIPRRAAEIGTEVHRILLEPDTDISPGLTQDWAAAANRIAWKATQDDHFRKATDLHGSFTIKQNEVHRYEYWHIKGIDYPVPVKGIADRLIIRPMDGGGITDIVDVKTSSMGNAVDFAPTILKYGYDVQAAFYMRLFDAPRFLWYVIPKGEEIEPFTISLTRDENLYKAAAEKLEEIIAYQESIASMWWHGDALPKSHLINFPDANGRPTL